MRSPFFHLPMLQMVVQYNFLNGDDMLSSVFLTFSTQAKWSFFGRKPHIASHWDCLIWGCYRKNCTSFEGQTMLKKSTLHDTPFITFHLSISNSGKCSKISKWYPSGEMSSKEKIHHKMEGCAASFRNIRALKWEILKKKLANKIVIEIWLRQILRGKKS